MNQPWNLNLDISWQCHGYVAELPPLKPWFGTTQMPILFCLTATEIACTIDGGDHEVMYRLRRLTLAEWEGLRMWERWGWSMWADCWGWVRFSANACMWICWRWGEPLLEWNGLPWEHFFGSQCGGRRGRDRRPNLVGGVEGESHRQNA